MQWKGSGWEVLLTNGRRAGRDARGEWFGGPLPCTEESLGCAEAHMFPLDHGCGDSFHRVGNINEQVYIGVLHRTHGCLQRRTSER